MAGCLLCEQSLAQLHELTPRDGLFVVGIWQNDLGKTVKKKKKIVIPEN